jgi:hypothetical protein
MTLSRAALILGLLLNLGGLLGPRLANAEGRFEASRAESGSRKLVLGGLFGPRLFPWQTDSSRVPALTTEQLGVNLARKARGLSPEVATMALRASSCAASQGRSPRARYLAIIDYSKPSTLPRFWLFDALAERLLEQSYVAHGRNSGELFATDFSNKPGSLQSSLGLFFADEPYLGQHGRSLRLQGLEPNFNDKAYDRAIVMHGADYVSDSFISKHNRLGRSLGCPALPLRIADRAITTLEQGAYLFAYYPNDRYLSSSRLLNCQRQRARA